MKHKQLRVLHEDNTLLGRVRTLLCASDMSALDIYKATGVTPSHQYAIRSGRTKDPSVNVVQALYEFLTGKTLGL